MGIESNGFLLYVCIGVFAQLVGSSFGMGYGTISSACLLFMGVPPIAASASANTASFFSSMASAIFHWKVGNVDRESFTRLLIPGIIGSIAGATLLFLAPANLLKPLVGIYLLGLAFMIGIKSWKKAEEIVSRKTAHLRFLGFLGGFFGAIGGGGWGPIVNGQLVASGHCPRESIGSSNAAKPFVTLAAALSFAALMTEFNWGAVLGLTAGGLLAAPISARLTAKMSSLTLMVSMAVLLTFVSIKILEGSADLLKPLLAQKMVKKGASGVY